MKICLVSGKTFVHNNVPNDPITVILCLCSVGGAKWDEVGSSKEVLLKLPNQIYFQK